MTDPIDLNARRDERVPEPEGEPAITMPMDSDQIIFRDQAALDDYVAGALGDLKARNAELEADIQNIAGGALVEEAETSVRRIHAEVERDVARQALTSADAMNRHWDEINAHRDLLVAERDALRAELDNLRETLAQKIETTVLPIDHTKTVTVVDVQRQCAAIVRGSDDEA